MIVDRLLKIIIKRRREKKYKKYGEIADSAIFYEPKICTCPGKIYLEENTHIYENSQFIISDVGESGRFVMKKKSGAAQGLTVITNAHSVNPVIGKFHMDCLAEKINDIEKDVIVEEDVWIGANVTLLPGVRLGRGCVVGAGSVVRKKVPPYSIVCGNPAKVVGFTLLPDEIVKHEKALYNEEERISILKLEKNYKKYYVNRYREIADFLE